MRAPPSPQASSSNTADRGGGVSFFFFTLAGLLDPGSTFLFVNPLLLLLVSEEELAAGKLFSLSERSLGLEELPMLLAGAELRLE